MHEVAIGLKKSNPEEARGIVGGGERVAILPVTKSELSLESAHHRSLS
jgi:hypothetical protein